MKIGVLLPTSKLYPSLMIDFTAGIRLALAEQNCEDKIELVFESINQGTDKNLILNSLNKLVLQHQTEVNILFCNYLLLEDIASSINALQRPTILTNMGGNIPNLFDPGEFIFSNSFGLWESAHLAAKWGISNFGKKVGHGSYFYEAGYNLYASFFQGLVASQGEVVLNQVSDFNPNPEDFVNFMKQAELETPDFLYALYSERDAVNFLTKLSQSPENGKYPIVTSGVLLNDEIIEKIEGIPKRVYNVSTWDKSDNTEANKKFFEMYSESSGIDPNYFSLLGYECAGTICSAMKLDSWSKSGKDQAKAIKEISFTGPRGVLNYNNSLNSTSLEHNVYEINENLERVKLETIGVLESRDKIIELSRVNSNPTGWFQPYLCQ